MTTTLRYQVATDVNEDGRVAVWVSSVINGRRNPSIPGGLGTGPAYFPPKSRRFARRFARAQAEAFARNARIEGGAK